MTNQEFNDFCNALPATTHVMQWGGADVWKVGGKVFAIGGWQPGDKPAFTFKTSDLDFHLLSDQSAYRPAPYFATRGMKWIQCIDPESLEENEITHYLTESHRIVSLNLSKKLQKELNLNQA